MYSGCFLIGCLSLLLAAGNRAGAQTQLAALVLFVGLAIRAAKKDPREEFPMAK
jgi:hypothetical protein